MSINDYSKYLEIAKDVIVKSSDISLSYYEKNIEIETKEDQTPVTVADRETEAFIINSIKKVFPDHAFYGEETGMSDNESDFLWIIDPIDGTKNYIGGIPFWGTLLALRHKEDFVVGVSYIPCLKELCYASKNSGAFLNDKKIQVSDISNLSESMISFGSLNAFKKSGYKDNIYALIDSCKRQRSFGDLYPYHLLASGKLEIVIEAAIKIVDIAPFVTIINEAGGQVSDIDGNAISLKTTSFVATNKHILNQSLDFFKQS